MKEIRNIQSEIIEAIVRFKSDHNVKRAEDTFNTSITSFVHERQKLGKTEEEVGKEVAEICYNVGSTVFSPSDTTAPLSPNAPVLTEEERGILVAGLFNFIVSMKYNEVYRRK